MYGRDDDEHHSDSMDAVDAVYKLQWLMQNTGSWSTTGTPDQKLARAKIEQMHAWAIRRLGC